MSIKDMKRTSWQRILRKDYVASDCEICGVQAKKSLIIVREMTAPLVVHYDFADVRIVDEDYGWLQIALKDGFVWLTAMFDSFDRLVSLYFDITNGNRFDDPENPYFEDMYLDIVISCGEIRILDQDELDEALENGDITREEYNHAEQVCRELYEYLLVHKDEVAAFCIQSYRELKSMIK